MGTLVYLLNLLWVALSLGAFVAVTLPDRRRDARRPVSHLPTAKRHLKSAA